MEEERFDPFLRMNDNVCRANETKLQLFDQANNDLPLFLFRNGHSHGMNIYSLHESHQVNASVRLDRDLVVRPGDPLVCVDQPAVGRTDQQRIATGTVYRYGQSLAKRANRQARNRKERSR